MDSGPPPEAYERVTNPERFQAVVDAARVLIDEIASAHDVTVSSDGAEFAGTWFEDVEMETVRLKPRQGAPLAFGFVTSPPAVLVRAGDWCAREFPDCMCDACDASPDDEIAELTELVSAAVEGRYGERLTWWSLRYGYDGRQVAGKLKRGDRRRLGARGWHRWPPWPRRDGL